MSDDVETRLSRLEAKVETLEGGRPGRRKLPIVVSEVHVCGVDPGRDSTACADASIYRRQRGCKGDRCTQLYDEYYEARRKATK